MTGEPGFDPRVVAARYDDFAREYEARFYDDLLRLPVDQEVLATVAAAVAEAVQEVPGLVLDLGCGPGQVGRFVVDRCPAWSVGVDLSPGMLHVARRRSGAAPVVADIRALPVRAGSAVAVAAFYCVHHLPRGQLGSFVVEAARVLVPGGVIAIATHEGAGCIGEDADAVRGTFFTGDEIAAALRAAGLRVDREWRRSPLAHEFAADRYYVAARAEQ